MYCIAPDDSLNPKRASYPRDGERCDPPHLMERSDFPACIDGREDACLDSPCYICAIAGCYKDSAIDRIHNPLWIYASCNSQVSQGAQDIKGTCRQLLVLKETFSCSPRLPSFYCSFSYSSTHIHSSFNTFWLTP